jgi:hypothetical protein
MAAVPIAIGTKRNSFRAAKNQKIASDFLIFCRSIKFYLLPIAIGTGGDSTYETVSKKSFAAKGGRKKLHEPLCILPR